MPINRRSLVALFPGVAMCGVISVVAEVLGRVEGCFVSRPLFDSIVIAILLGALWRTIKPPPSWYQSGIDFSAKTLLELAVILFGTAMTLEVAFAAGATVLGAIATLVVIALAGSYLVCRALHLPRRMAVLIACGNSICGNSAIIAVAPIIGADRSEIATAIAFTATLGVIVVLLLPALIPFAGLSSVQYGMVAGLTVYAVPQVLAVAVPFGPGTVQIALLVKLARVLMLIPIILLVSIEQTFIHRKDAEGYKAAQTSIWKYMPWFVVGFIAMLATRSAGWLPDALMPAFAFVSRRLTIISMAALGLQVDLRLAFRTAPRVIAAVTLSLAILCALSLLVVLVFKITPLSS